MPVHEISELFVLSVSNIQRKLLQSICDHGLLPLACIPNSAVSIPMTSTSMIANNICVNFVILADNPSEAEIRTISQTLALEEYTGVGGIALERGWPLASMVPTQCADEILQRLTNVCVFILKPPTQDGYMKNDGFSAERSHCITGELPLNTRRIVEVKTEYHFAIEDMKAILVPAPFLQIVEEIFRDTDLEIITVKLDLLQFRRMPETTTILYAQAAQGEIVCRVPAYQQAFAAYISSHPGDNFSVHAVRLPTIYDVELRYVRDSFASKTLLDETQASRLVGYADNSAWYSVPKQFVVSRTEMITRLRTKPGTAAEVVFFQQLASQIENVNKNQGELFRQYKAAVDNYKMCRYKDELDPGQVKELEKLNACILRVNLDQLQYTMISYPLLYAETVKRVVNDWFRYEEEQENQFKKQAQAATTIQRFFKGHSVRKIVAEVRANQIEHDKAKAVYDKAVNVLEASRSRLFGRVK